MNCYGDSWTIRDFPISRLAIWKESSFDYVPAKPERLIPYPETRIDIVELNDDDPRLIERGWWIGAHVQNDVFWPLKAHSVQFERSTLFVLPATGNLMPAVFVRGNEAEQDELTAKISRFLSAWSWVAKRGIRVVHWGGGGQPFRSQRSQIKMQTRFYDFEHLPETLPDDAALALAFFREGLSIEHDAYSFLSFYKVINSKFKGKEAQRNWIRDNLDKISDRDVVQRIEELRVKLKGIKIQDYIYTSCRNAVAHSHPDADVVNPDNQIDLRRIRSDLPIVRSLAERMINVEFGIHTETDIWNSKEHRLAGARWMVGDTILKQILAGQFVPRRNVRLPKLINLKARRKPQYPLLQSLHFKVLRVENYGIRFFIEPTSAVFRVEGELDFKNGELNIDLLSGMAFFDDGTSEGADLASQHSQLFAELLMNGKLQLIDAENGRLLAESKPIVPTNMMFDFDASKMAIESWKQKAFDRKKSGR